MYGWIGPAKVLAGRGSLSELPALMGQAGGRRCIVVVDPVLMETAPVRDALEELSGSVDARVYTDIAYEPSAASVEKLASRIRSDCAGAEFGIIAAIGGGSAMDTAKLVAVLLLNEVPLESLMGVGKVPGAGVPTILVPTTAGTGAEATPNAIVSGADGVKAGIVSPFLMAGAVILDPDLTLSAPPGVVAATGIDALAHAVESYTGKKANPLSDDYAEAAVRGICTSLGMAFAEGGRMDAREEMLVSSFRAGQALTASGTTAVHALAYAIGSAYHIPHGVANSMLLVPVLRYNAESCGARLAELARMIGAGSTAESFVRRVDAMIEELLIPRRLSAFGAKPQDIPDLALRSLQASRLIENNPRSIGAAEIESIFASIL